MLLPYFLEDVFRINPIRSVGKVPQSIVTPCEIEVPNWIKGCVIYSFSLEKAIEYGADMGEIVVYDDRGQKKDDFVFHHSKLQPRDSSLINTNKMIAL